MAITGIKSAYQDMRMKVREMEVDGTIITGTAIAVLDGVTPGTATANKALVAGATKQIAGWKDARNTPITKQVAPAAKTGTVTLTAAELATGLIVGTPVALANYTLPLASALDSELINAGFTLSDDDAIQFSIINLGADTFTITVLANTGWTTVGQMLVQDNSTVGERSSALFRARRTGSNAWTLYRIA